MRYHAHHVDELTIGREGRLLLSRPEQLSCAVAYRLPVPDEVPRVPGLVLGVVQVGGVDAVLGALGEPLVDVFPDASLREAREEGTGQGGRANNKRWVDDTTTTTTTLLTIFNAPRSKQKSQSHHVRRITTARYRGGDR